MHTILKRALTNVDKCDRSLPPIKDPQTGETITDPVRKTENICIAVCGSLQR